MIAENLKQLLIDIEKAAVRSQRSINEITLLAVTKGRSVEEIQTLYDLGIRDFGENRLSEAFVKMPLLPADIRWHFIGHLQRNKVAKVLERFTLIHSIDSLELAEKVSELSKKRHCVTPVLIEINTSNEKTKQGFSIEACRDAWPNLIGLQGIEIRGLMTMAPLTEDFDLIRNCFRDLKSFRESLAKQCPILSMGMSHDFSIAIEEGATLLRIGSALFR